MKSLWLVSLSVAIKVSQKKGPVYMKMHNNAVLHKKMAKDWL